jgi:hypothetical protein
MAKDDFFVDTSIFMHRYAPATYPTWSDGRVGSNDRKTANSIGD